MILPGGAAAQSFAVGAGAAILTTTRTLIGEAGGGELAAEGHAELQPRGPVGIRADLTAAPGSYVFAGAHGVWHPRGADRALDPYLFAGPTLQFIRYSSQPEANWNRVGVTGGLGATLHPSGGSLGILAELRVHQFFARRTEASALAQFTLGLRYRAH
ncbi:MAG TPA: hypothetical protein VF046_06185 [Gemmatimonadales bacterium]